MELNSFLIIYALLLGLIIGSFLNVCIYRIPIKKSIIIPPSTCPECGERIKFYDNVPLISYALLLGRCRYCRHPLSWRYPTIEALTGLLSMALFIRYGLSFQYLLLLLFAGALVCITFIDLQHKIIPDVISLPGIVVGWGASFFIKDISWLDSLIGIIAGGGALFLVAFVYEHIAGREGMGGGDIKLLAMIGAWMGWRSLPLIVLMSSLSGAIVGLAFILIAGKGYRVKIPFGPFLSLGTLLYIFFAYELTNWYLLLL
ncbi:MAG: prepilin peptidase [Desulfobacterales bacterium]|nr:prepilin peptidase [Desulfobacterales bacterium]